MISEGSYFFKRKHSYSILLLHILPLTTERQLTSFYQNVRLAFTRQSKVFTCLIQPSKPCLSPTSALLATAFPWRPCTETAMCHLLLLPTGPLEKPLTTKSPRSRTTRLIPSAACLCMEQRRWLPSTIRCPLNPYAVRPSTGPPQSSKLSPRSPEAATTWSRRRCSRSSGPSELRRVCISGPDAL